MDLRRRLPAAVLAVVALALAAVIVSRVSAGADPAPRDTTPITIAPDQDPTPSTTPTHGDDDTSGKVTPRVRDDDDDDGPDDDDDDHTGPGDDDD
ncbi:hypothetical protein ASE12_04800 [Aeromicrobium sp. Root236]|uniref:hypothetical protein n=1 Tax=Aeromicrobium sp. Root236 TaxID=1736498 RepID=UPI0006F425C7|nr:hypothetical protein [Aeromicrobium sp. Root236]KRC64142.1 hypothetical protein ASE12_04800 [Aeromicrobium sp. Root236]